MALEITFFYNGPMTNPTYARQSFDRMRGMGAGAVCFNVYEQDLIRWTRDMPRIVNLARSAGLRVYLSPGRHGGVFSGGIVMPSLFAYTNPDTLIVPDEGGQGVVEADHPFRGYFDRQCCVNHPRFRAYMLEELQKMLDQLEPDGVDFDEPKGVTLPCKCEHCMARRRDGETPYQANLRTQVEFLDELCRQVKAYRRDAVTMMVLSEKRMDYMLASGELESLDVLGISAYWVPSNKDLNWLRTRIPEALNMLAATGKKTQVWAQNWGLPAEEEGHLLEAYRIMIDAQPDQLWNFWYWRNNDNPERVMELTAQGLQYARRIAGGSR